MMPKFYSCKHTPAQQGEGAARAMAVIETSDLASGQRTMQIWALCPMCLAAFAQFLGELGGPVQK